MVKEELTVRRLGDLWGDELGIVLKDHVARKLNIEIDGVDFDREFIE